MRKFIDRIFDRFKPLVPVSPPQERHPDLPVDERIGTEVKEMYVKGVNFSTDTRNTNITVATLLGQSDLSPVDIGRGLLRVSESTNVYLRPVVVPGKVAPSWLVYLPKGLYIYDDSTRSWSATQKLPPLNLP